MPGRRRGSRARSQSGDLAKNEKVPAPALSRVDHLALAPLASLPPVRPCLAPSTPSPFAP